MILRPGNIGRRSRQRGMFGISSSVLSPAAAAASPPIWDAATVSSPLVLQNADTRLYLPTGNSAIAKTARCTKALTSGKWYWEVDVVDVITGNTTTTGVGIAEAAQSLSANLGNTSSANSVGMWCSGAVYTNGGSLGTIGVTFNDGARLMFALDIAAGKFWAGNGGTWAGGGNPAAGTSPLVSGLSSSGTYYPAASPWSSVGETVKLDIKGGTDLNYAVPTGFTSYSA